MKTPKDPDNLPDDPIQRAKAIVDASLNVDTNDEQIAEAPSEDPQNDEESSSD